MYSTLLQSWVTHCLADLSSDFFWKPLQWHTTPRGWSAVSSHSCSRTNGTSPPHLRLLLTLYGAFFHWSKVPDLLMLLLTGNTQSYTLFICAINIFMFHGKSNCFSRNHKNGLPLFFKLPSSLWLTCNWMPQVVVPSGRRWTNLLCVVICGVLGCELESKRRMGLFLN